MIKLIILDRDGVINYESSEYIKNPDEWIPIPGSLEAITQLNQAGFKVTVATNQSGVGRGLYTEETLTAIHDKMQHHLEKLGGNIDGIYHCPHKPNDGCECRKPRPGLLHQIAKDYQCDLSTVIFIGDRLTDIHAAKIAGAKPIMLTRSVEGELPDDLPIYTNLAEAVDAILKEGEA